jgi:ubiquinone/menaquinone biosynthesis C-methylase UbiE
MITDPKRLVTSGYDGITASYLARYGASSVRDVWLSELLQRLPAQGGARVLDLGCGAGIPVARALAAAGHTVVGVDGSIGQISLARNNVPSVAFIHADMTAVDFPARSIDAVTAFYSITHVPRLEHDHLLRRMPRSQRAAGLDRRVAGDGDVLQPLRLRNKPRAVARRGLCDRAIGNNGSRR